MFRDLGFIWFLAKDILGWVYFFSWIASFVFMYKASEPWNHLLFANVVSGFVLVGIIYMMPLFKVTLECKYRAYRAKKEEAWNILKEGK